MGERWSSLSLVAQFTHSLPPYIHIHTRTTSFVLFPYTYILTHILRPTGLSVCLSCSCLYTRHVSYYRASKNTFFSYFRISSLFPLPVLSALLSEMTDIPSISVFFFVPTVPISSGVFYHVLLMTDYYHHEDE